MISAGFQNIGFRTKVNPTQLMITNSTNVFFQFDNQSSSPATILICAVTDNTSVTLGAIGGQGSLNL